MEVRKMRQFGQVAFAGLGREVLVELAVLAGDGDQALMALAQGAQWVRRTALPNVPAAFRESFLQRNATNRALLAAADRRLAQ